MTKRKPKYENHCPSGDRMIAIFDSNDKLVMLLPTDTPLTVIEGHLEAVQLAEAIAAERYRKWCGCRGCKAALKEVENAK